MKKMPRAYPHAHYADLPRLPWDEFQTFGYLQEVNRNYFHPLGLQLAISRNVTTQEVVAIEILDFREDIEGVTFDTIDLVKVRAVAHEEKCRKGPRVAAMGSWIQPTKPTKGTT